MTSSFIIESNRIKWVDSLKFLGILAIYIGHLGKGGGPFTDFVWLYHVPLFFFISGFFSDYKNNTNFKDFIKSRFKRLMLPYYAFTLLLLFINASNNNLDFISLYTPIKEILYGVRNDNYVGTVWFFNCLFSLSILDYIFMRAIKNKYIILLISILSLAIFQLLIGHNPASTPSWFLNIDTAIGYWWLLAMGRCLFPCLKSNALFKKTISGYTLLFILLMVATYELLNGKPIITAIMLKLYPDFQAGLVYSITENMFTILTLVLLNVFIAKIISGSTYIYSTGRNTINICGFEMITKTIIPSVFYTIGLSFSLSNHFMAIVYSLLCIYISNTIGYWLSNNIGGVFSTK
ncbi:acyltransferase family protein [Morganella morganii]|uniref:acyltransferase family protein n=1 Tax=Morganella morganii TaxID=582 RepID=UPI00301CCD02